MEYLILNKKLEGIFMRCFYTVLIVVGILVLLILLVLLLVRLRMCWAACKVRRCSYEEKKEKLDRALNAFGFCYDEENDAVCSGMYPWQREMGYCRAYDEGAAAMYMVFDCEPIYFDYGGGRYLIELWKGQYGCTTGAEIGLYVNRSGDMEKAPEKLFYECVRDEERLPLHFVLCRNGERILERNELHWWLTCFQVGICSEPAELTLEVGICFPNVAMCRAFWEGLLRAGYSRNDIRVEQNCVFICFRKPLSCQPDLCGRRCRRRILRRNCRNCRLYCWLTKCFCTTLDKISFICFCFPLLYRIIIRVGMRRRKRRLRRCRRKICSWN